MNIDEHEICEIDDSRNIVSPNLECRKCSVTHSMFDATCDFYSDVKTGIPLSIWQGEKKCPHFKEIGASQQSD